MSSSAGCGGHAGPRGQSTASRAEWEQHKQRPSHVRQAQSLGILPGRHLLDDDPAAGDPFSVKAPCIHFPSGPLHGPITPAAPCAPPAPRMSSTAACSSSACMPAAAAPCKTQTRPTGPCSPSQPAARCCPARWLTLLRELGAQDLLGREPGNVDLEVGQAEAPEADDLAGGIGGIAESPVRGGRVRLRALASEEAAVPPFVPPPAPELCTAGAPASRVHAQCIHAQGPACPDPARRR